MPTNSHHPARFADALSGANLGELLDAAENGDWPSPTCDAEWLMLRTWALQTESLMLDEAENVAWEEQMRALMRRDLDYAEWVTERTAALRERERARKLAQARLRDRYGFKRPRSRRLISRDVMAFVDRWANDPAEDTGSRIRTTPAVLWWGVRQIVSLDAPHGEGSPCTSRLHPSLHSPLVG